MWTLTHLSSPVGLKSKMQHREPKRVTRVFHGAMANTLGTGLPTGHRTMSRYIDLNRTIIGV